MKPRFTVLLAGAALITAGCGGPQGAGRTAPAAGRIIARVHPSGFEYSHDTYNGMGVASDGRVYYVLSSERPDVAGQMYFYDPYTDRTVHVGDLTEACGEKGMNAVAQGKSHVNFVEAEGRLWFATHIGYYSIIDDMEKPGVPPPGMKPYRGGHVLAYDLKTRRFEDHGIAPRGEGVLAMNMDPQRMRVYGLTWPTGVFFRYDVRRREWKEIGAFFEEGENGRGPTYRTICRALAVDPRDGSVYFTTGDGVIHRYRYDTEQVEPVRGDDLRKDYFGQYDVTSPGHMAYNWRQVFWHPRTQMFYGVHGNSGYLFRFDPRAERVEVLDRITSEPSRRSGMFDQFSYGYLGFTLGPDRETIYYLTGGPIYVEGKRLKGKDSTGKGEAKGDENLHLVTWHIPTGRYRDHGAIFYGDGSHPTYVNSIAVVRDGRVFTLARVPRADGTFRTELISFRP
ncbi:MAG: hypothetical protein KatS3mg004_1504 [Bryobacteraceae bacterium]|nr:MAG: hypothetical protein KatS3mg004_1504 [Bryobacteraceae bacterium]